MNITLEEFKKEAVPYLAESKLLQADAKRIGTTPELFAEHYLETEQIDHASAITEAYERALAKPEGTDLSTTYGQLADLLELMLNEQNLSDIAKRLRNA